MMDYQILMLATLVLMFSSATVGLYLVTDCKFLCSSLSLSLSLSLCLSVSLSLSLRQRRNDMNK